MQDNASPHRAKVTLDDLANHGIEPIDWPALSPDLNPIETLWDKMKDILQHRHGHVLKPKRWEMRAWVLEAWDAIEETTLRDLIESMPHRCEAVIAAGGGWTKY